MSKTNYFAKRFAAKEAFVKSIGIGFRKGINFKERSVRVQQEYTAWGIFSIPVGTQGDARQFGEYYVLACATIASGTKGLASGRLQLQTMDGHSFASPDCAACLSFPQRVPILAAPKPKLRHGQKPMAGKAQIALRKQQRALR